MSDYERREINARSYVVWAIIATCTTASWISKCHGADPTFTVENKCPAFTVTNKCPAVQAAPARTGYPVRGSHWTYPGEIHAHLKSGQHAGKWPASWIDSLTTEEARSLHDDDHEGRVRWEFVPGSASGRPTPPRPSPVVSYTPRSLGWSYCPPGGT